MLSEIIEAFSTVSAADDMCSLWEARIKELFPKKRQRKMHIL